MSDDAAVEGLRAFLERRGKTLDRLAPGGRELIARLGVALVAFGEQAPKGFSEELEGITLFGADPEWQLSRLEEILNRWAPRQ